MTTFSTDLVVSLTLCISSATDKLRLGWPLPPLLVSFPFLLSTLHFRGLDGICTKTGSILTMVMPASR